MGPSVNTNSSGCHSPRVSYAHKIQSSFHSEAVESFPGVYFVWSRNAECGTWCMFSRWGGFFFFWVPPSTPSSWIWIRGASVAVWVVRAWRSGAERPERFCCQDGDIGAGKSDARVLKSSANVHEDMSYNFAAFSTVARRLASWERHSIYRGFCFFCVWARRCATRRGCPLALACTAMWWIRQWLTLLAGRDWLDSLDWTSFIQTPIRVYFPMHFGVKARNICWISVDFRCLQMLGVRFRKWISSHPGHVCI